MMKPWPFMLRSLLLLLLAGLSGQAGATHLMGSDITWKCKGKDTFEIVLTIYRDCNGVSLTNTPIKVSPDCGGASMLLTGSLSSPEDITPKCKTECSRCEIGACQFGYGIEKYTITSTVYLGGTNCCNFTISWEQCCRNSTITTGPTGNFYVESKLNRCANPCDNSPYFTTPPVAIFCTNQCIVFNPGVNDDDRSGNNQADSLAYFLTKPLSGAGTSISYSGNYNYLEPLDYDGAFGNPSLTWDPPKCRGFHLDTFTGDLKFRATRPDQTVLAIRVEEWRKDSTGKPIKIGEIRRDLQIIIIDCPANQPPNITGINGGSQTKADFCVGENRCFWVKGFDLDITDTVYMDWNKTIPGASFKVENHVQNPKGTFCWTPKPEHVRTFPWQFVVSAQDDACPVPGRTSKSFRINVLPSPEASYNVQVGKCGEVTFKAFNAGKLPIQNFVWTGEGEPPLYSFQSSFTHKYRDSGTFKFTLVAQSPNGCSSSYTDSVTIQPYVKVTLPPDTALCIGSMFTINSTRKNGYAPYRYMWNTGSTFSNLTFKLTQDTVFRLDIWDGTGCSNYDSIRVRAQLPPKPDLGADRIACGGDTVWLDPGLPKAKYFWYKNNMLLAFANGQKLPVTDSGYYKVVVIDSVGCSGADSVKIGFNPLVKASSGVINGCHGDSIRLDGGSGDSFTWKHLETGFIVGNSKYYAIPKLLASEYNLEITARSNHNGITCISVDTVVVKVYQKPQVTLSELPDQCVKNNALDLTKYGKPTGGIWKMFGKPAAVRSNYFYPEQAGVGTHYLSYTFYDSRTYCPKTDSIQIKVDSLPKVNAGKDTFRCMLDAPMLLNWATPAGGVWTGPGVQGFAGSQMFVPKDARQGLHRLIYHYVDWRPSQCESTDTIFVRVYDSIAVDAGRDKSICMDEGLLKLEGKPLGGKWFDAKGNQVTNTVDPVATGPGLHKFIYIQSHGGQCEQRDSVYIRINALPEVSVSTEDGRTVFCQNEHPMRLVGKHSPAGGLESFYGPGVMGKFFDPVRAGVGTHQVVYMYRDTSLCKQADTLMLEVTPQPEVKILTDQHLCQEQEEFIIRIQTFQTDSLNWTISSADGGMLMPVNKTTMRFVPSAAQREKGQFTVMVQAIANGECAPVSDEKTFYIHATPKVVFSATPDIGCVPHYVTFTNETEVDDGYITQYIWYFGDGDSSTEETPHHFYRTAGTYKVELVAITNYGCRDNYFLSSSLVVLPKPQVDFTADPQLTDINLPMVQFTNLSTNLDDKVSYLWNFNDPAAADGGISTEANPIHTFSDTGKYTVVLTAINGNGCKDTLSKIAYIDVRAAMQVFVPNAFWPGGNGPDRNNVFRPVVTEVHGYVFRVYNRWGSLLFETTDPTQGWDGTSGGEKAPEGAYVYVIKAWDKAGEEYNYSGTVTLLR